MNEVAEEAAPPEDEVRHPGLARQVQAAGVAAGVEQADVAGARGIRINDCPGTGPEPVGADQQVALGARTVGERGPYPCRRALGGVEALAVLHGDTPAYGLVAQYLVEIGSRDRTGRHRERGEFPATTADERHLRGVHAEVAHRVAQVEDVEGRQAVDGQREERPDAVGAVAVSLVDNRVDAGPLQRHRGHRTGDPATNDQCLLGHAACLVTSLLVILRLYIL